MVLGLRSSEREKEIEKERIRESILKFTQDTGEEEKYSRYNKLTLDPRHLPPSLPRQRQKGIIDRSGVLLLSQPPVFMLQ